MAGWSRLLMAWIESHQELRENPKVARLARMLDVPKAHAVGTLHLLWWWATDHAPDGDLTDYDSADLAAACEWDGDPEDLVKALRDCGPGTKVGFIEAETGDRWVLHNWWEYAGKLVARREQDRQRKRAERSGAGCETSDRDQQTGSGRPPDIPRMSNVENRTEQNTTSPPPDVRRGDVDALCDLLAALVEGNGAKAKVSKQWRDSARLLLDKDNRDPAEVERVMRWALADRFWMGNIFSMPTFREKYDQLRIKSGLVAPSSPADEDWMKAR